MDIEKLENRWSQLFASDKQKKIVKETFKSLVDKYSEKHRYYHKLEHIDACLEHLDEVNASLSAYYHIEVAVWFHDVVYDPKRNDNEQRSAEYAKTFLKSINSNISEINKIEQLILLTKHPSYPKTDDEKYLLDIDLSILGARKALYDKYEQWIRKEYAFVPNPLYKEGRGKVLYSFANLERIFHTDYFYKKYEIQARENINRALLNLEEG